MNIIKVHCSVKHPTKKCIVCGKPLKLNLVNRKPKAEYCFKHYPQSKKNKAGANDRSQNLEVSSQNKN